MEYQPLDIDEPKKSSRWIKGLLLSLLCFIGIQFLFNSYMIYFTITLSQGLELMGQKSLQFLNTANITFTHMNILLADIDKCANIISSYCQ